MKNPFYFSKGQRIGIAIVLFLLVAVVLLNLWLPHYFASKETACDWAQYKDSAQLFEAQLQEKESEWREKWTAYPPSNNWESKKKKRTEQSVELFVFDPNTTDSADFVRLGLRPYMASNILKYRAKGGFYHTAEQFSKLYGLSAEQFAQLKPYIQIAPLPDTKQKTNSVRHRFVSNKKDTILELNTADTTELQMIRGIGRATAFNIVEHRRALGGFCQVEQLKEVKGITDDTYKRIKGNFTVNPTLIKPIKINKANVEKLRAHPYIKTFPLAKAIFDFRRDEFGLKNIEQLLEVEGIDEVWIEKMTPYLTFEK